MSVLRFVPIVLAMSFTTIAAAGDFDGSVPLVCTAEKAYDCLPEGKCNLVKPDTDIAPIFGIDFARKEIRSPYRTAILPVLYTTKNSDSLVLQGAQLLLAWSALVDQKTGAMTVSIADSKGAYVAFGKCKVKKAM